jgi:hypothetical protein
MISPPYLAILDDDKPLGQALTRLRRPREEIIGLLQLNGHRPNQFTPVWKNTSRNKT